MTNLDVESLEPLNNYIIVKVSSGSNRVRIASLDLTLDTSFNPEEHVPVTGTVVKLPKKLTCGYEGGKHTQRIKFKPNDMLWKTEVELAVGDTVLFDYLEALTAWSQYFNPFNQFITDRIVFNQDGIYIFVHYSRVYCRLDQSGWTPVNGYAMVRWIEEKSYYQVEKVGVPVKHYSNPKNKDPKVNPGEFVSIVYKSVIPIKHELLQPKTFLIRPYKILARIAEV
jgi:hypothetical protein